jgi:hypothetical protein
MTAPEEDGNVLPRFLLRIRACPLCRRLAHEGGVPGPPPAEGASRPGAGFDLSPGHSFPLTVPYLNQKPWAEGHAAPGDVLKAHRYLSHLFGRKQRTRGGDEEMTDRNQFFPNEVFCEFRRLVETLVRDDRIFISDRKLVKRYKLFRIRAWLLHGVTVTRDDPRLLMYLGETHRGMALLREKAPASLGEA